MQPRVSVVLATHNGASRGYLGEAIESVINQSYKNYELLIVDDGSNDHTRRECSQFLNNPNVRYVHQENKGLPGARNTGIKASCGEFICFLDDDDVWKPNKLQRQMDFIEARLCSTDNWGLLFTWLELIDEQGNILGYRGHSKEGSIYRTLLYKNTIDAPSSVLIKREVFDKIGYFDEYFRCCEDWDMWLRISREYLIFPVKEFLVQYREHTTSMSADYEKISHYAKAVLDKALILTPEDVDKKVVYARFYLNRSIVLFAAENYRQFRSLFFQGVKLSPKALNLEHLVLFFLSFTGLHTVRLIKKIKRYLHKKSIDSK
jgi:glycosyltransferase involved in cell wall biosynthesis